MSEKPSFARMPGQIQEASARERRQELQDLDMPQAEMFQHLAVNPIELEEDTKEVEAYAVGSFVIEIFWDYLKERIAQGEFPALTPPSREYGEAQTETIPQQFVTQMSARIAALQSTFIDSYISTLRTKSDEEVTKSDALIARYFNVRSENGKLPFTSMKDLIYMTGRMADVVPRVYQQERGRDATEEEVLATIRAISTKRTYMEIMTNSRGVGLAILGQLEGRTGYGDLNDKNSTFDPRAFEIKEQEEGGSHVIVNPKFVLFLQKEFANNAAQQAEKGLIPARALQCPVLYTGKFIQMYDWVADEFEKFYKGE